MIMTFKNFTINVLELFKIFSPQKLEPTKTHSGFRNWLIFQNLPEVFQTGRRHCSVDRDTRFTHGDFASSCASEGQ